MVRLVSVPLLLLMLTGPAIGDEVASDAAVTQPGSALFDEEPLGEDVFTDETPEDERPLYYGSEVVVVSDRPARFEPFMPARATAEGNLAEQIAWTPHVTTGGYGASTYPAVRGLSAEHVGFEYDGVPLNSLQNGLADLALFEVLELDASVVRGPFARTAAGRSALAAVSLEPAHGPASGVSLTTGSQRDGARLSLRRGDVSLRAGFFSDEGHVHKTSAGGFGLEVGARTRLGDAALTYIQIDRGVPGPGADWPYGDGAAFAGDLEDELVIARVGLNPISIARPGFYVIRQRQEYSDALSEPTHVTASGGAIIDFDLEGVAPGAEATGSFDYSRIDSSDPLNLDLGTHSRTSASVVASHTVEHGVLRFAVEGAGSYTSDFDAAATGALSVAAVSDPWRAWVSWGRSYRAPTMNELYWPEDSWSAGNEDLEPERVTTLEAGGAGRVGHLRGSVSAYRSDATDLIGWVMSEVDFKSRPMNVGEARLKGVELELGADVGGLAIDYAATFSTAEDADSGLSLPYRPETSQLFAVSTEAGPLASELRMRFAGEVYVDATENEGRTLDGYGVIDFSARLDLPWEGVSVGFEGLNILDEKYETRQYYAMPGLEWRLSLMLGWEEDV